MSLAIQKSTENFSCNFAGNSLKTDTLISCIFAQLPYFLNYVQFQWLTVAVIVPIMLISIFGKIKESYRWFIFNQACWDLFLIFDVICAGSDDSSCSYSLNDDNDTSLASKLVYNLLANAAKCALYGPIFLLTLSRFLCMYFPRFYGHHFSSPFKICMLIIGFQAGFLILVCAYDWLQTIQAHINDQKFNECLDNFCLHFDKTQAFIDCNMKLYVPCVSSIPWENPQWQNIIQGLKPLTEPVMLLLADIFAILVIFKVIQQLKYQAQFNCSSLKASLRIACVMLFQCCFLTFLCILSLSSIYTYEIYRYTKSSLPIWFSHLSKPLAIQWFSVIRAFCDGFMVLIVLREYREKLIGFFKFIMLIVKNPKTALEELNTKSIRRKTITVISKAPASTMMRKKSVSPTVIF